MLEKLLTNLSETLNNERSQSESYKEMFAAGKTHTGMLRELDVKMRNHVLDACLTIKTRSGKSVTKEQLLFLFALPFLCKTITKNIEVEEGPACCVDKAYFVLSKEFTRLGEI